MLSDAANCFTQSTLPFSPDFLDVLSRNAPLKFLEERIESRFEARPENGDIPLDRVDTVVALERIALTLDLDRLA
jgi:hypothetical protein